VTDEDPWARLRFEVRRLAGLIAEVFDSVDRAHRLIRDLTERVERLEHDDD
jgi:hypothetical protein